MSTPRKTDVLIIGGGPVGLLISYQLARLNIPTYTIEQHDKAHQAMYGRATTLFPRTSEMLDQIDLNDTLTQTGFIGRSHVTFRNGKKVHRKGWNLITRVYDTFFDYALSIRQKYSEDIFREKLVEAGGEFESGVVLNGFTVDEDVDDGYKVKSTVTNAEGTQFTVKSKFIVGADGARSTVRKVAEIPFEGETTTHRWIRIDGVVKTNMPDTRVGFAAIESPGHGNVLGVALDHGRTRIGFALSPKLYEKYGDGMTEEDAKREAVQAMAPFELEFESVDWWTIYAIGQRVAESFRERHAVILAGDACHTHPSGAAQGMNTGIHDTINLSWKLAGVLKGWYSDAVLDTNGDERRPIAQKLINIDKTISSLILGVVPKGFVSASGSTEPNQLLNDVLDASSEFFLGLGVNYQRNILNKKSSTSTTEPGCRGPDVLIRRPGLAIPLRLFSITKNRGRFWTIIFAGLPLQTRPKIQKLRTYLNGDSFTKSLAPVFNLLTLIACHGLQPDETLGVDHFGDAFYDVDESAHVKYGISKSEGGIVVLRPDGTLGFSAALDEGAEVGKYFGEFVSPT